MKKRLPQMEFIKKKNEVDFIANLLITLCSENNEQFILLKGNIGTGKTTLVKEIAKVLKEENTVISPTFNKMFVYDKFVHIDAYNLQNQNLMPYEDFFEDKLVIIEWPEMLNQKINSYFVVEIIYIDEDARKYIIQWGS